MWQEQDLIPKDSLVRLSPSFYARKLFSRGTALIPSKGRSALCVSTRTTAVVSLQSRSDYDEDLRTDRPTL
jgi:hypothetical protein